MATIASDAYTRADSTTTIGTADTGQSYTVVAGTWGINTNKAYSVNGADGELVYIESGLGAHSITADVSKTGGSSMSLGVFAQYSDVNNFYYAQLWTGSSVHELLKVVGGSHSSLTSTPAGGATSATYKVVVAASAQALWVNSVETLNTTDTEVPAGTKVGFRLGQGGAADPAARWDNLLVEGTIPQFPQFVGASAQNNVGSGTTGDAAIPASGQVAGKLILVHITSKANGAAISAPANEGWELIKTVTESTALQGAIFGKIWGNGATDDATPTFTCSISGTAGWGITATVWTNDYHSTQPWNCVVSGGTSPAVLASTVADLGAGSSTMTAPSVAAVGTHLTVIRAYESADDNAHGTFTDSLGTPGTAYGGASYDQSTSTTDYAQGMSYMHDVNCAASTGTATAAQSTGGPDEAGAYTIVLQIPPVRPAWTRIRPQVMRQTPSGMYVTTGI